MIVVIQSSNQRAAHAGHMTTRDGRPVLFVANPGKAPDETGARYARPDALSPFCVPWRKLVQGYNSNPRDNPLGLLAACRLYPHDIYPLLVERLGAEKVFILSAGWGLISASFLTPNYDIRFDPSAEPFRRRKSTDIYADFCMLPTECAEDLYFFGDENGLPLFRKLTRDYAGRRIVFHPAAQPAKAPGCALRPFETDGQAGWYRACAEAFLAAPPERQAAAPEPTEAPAARVARIEARLQSLRTRQSGASALAGGGVEPSAQTVRAAVRRADRQLAEYRWLTERLPQVDVSRDDEYRRRFSAFHRIAHRSPEWLDVYFRLLEVSKVVGAEFADVLDELWQETGRYEPAHTSRLVAATDPAKPVWDRFTLTRIGLRAPAYLDPDKLKKASDVYRRLREWYADYLEAPAGQRLVKLFDEAAPEHRQIHAQRKVEFALRRSPAGSGFIDPAGTASVSRTA